MMQYNNHYLNKCYIFSLNIAFFILVALISSCATPQYIDADSSLSPQESFKLGNAYLSGKGVKQDTSQAIALLESAANRGYVNAQKLLGFSYFDGKDALWANPIDKDYGKAIFWLDKSALNGDADSQELLSRVYAMGLGTKRDIQKAISWAELAAAQGNNRAKVTLGLLYTGVEGHGPLYSGLSSGPPIDEEKGFRIMLSASQSQDKTYYYPHLYLGIFYLHGVGTPIDYGKSKYYFDIAQKNALQSLQAVAQVYHKELQAKKL